MEGQPGIVQHLLEIGQARVRATENRHLFERDTGARESLDLAREPLVFRLGSRKRTRGGLGTGRPSRAQDLRRAAEARHEAVRELEHLRRRAVVLLQLHDGGAGKPLAQAEQPAR